MSKVILTVQDFLDLPSARIYNPDAFLPIEAVTIDSRNVPAKALFIAIKGERFDGHDFIKDAVKNGASAILIKKKKYSRYNTLDVPVITVDDTIFALGFLAGIWREKLTTKIIGITGSAGKTSVKEFTSVLLNEKYKVNRTLANHNNHIGVPQTLFRTNNKHEYLVLELGTNHFGEIAYTAGIAKPDFALITNVGNSHLEFLKNKQGVLKEKASLITKAVEHKGYILINNDDHYVNKLYPQYAKRLTYAIESKADVKGKIENYTKDGRALVSITYKGKKFNVELPVWGDQAVKNFIAAAAVALKTGLSGREIIAGAKQLKAYEKRFVVKELNGLVLVDDTYNANPDSMVNAIGMLGKLYPGKTKIAVLGDMLELGLKSAQHHKKLAGLLKKNKIDRVFTIGPMSEHIYDSLKATAIEVKHFISRTSLKRFLKRQKFNDSVLLFKGSRGMHMEEFLNIIQENN